MTASPLWESLSDETQLAYTYHGSYAPGGSGGLGTCTPGTQTGNGTGTLTYGYDQDGRQIARGGSYFTLVPTTQLCREPIAGLDLERAQPLVAGSPGAEVHRLRSEEPGRMPGGVGGSLVIEKAATF